MNVYICIYVYMYLHHGFTCAMVKTWYTDMFIQHHEWSSPAGHGFAFENCGMTTPSPYAKSGNLTSARIGRKETNRYWGFTSVVSQLISMLINHHHDHLIPNERCSKPLLIDGYSGLLYYTQ